MKIIIRADSGTVTGSGHVMRCLVLADELQEDIVFACRDISGNIASIIEKRGYQVKKLLPGLDESNAEFAEFVKNVRPDAVIFDNYELDIGIEGAIREYTNRIIVIDDLANRRHDCDILLDQNPCPAVHARYSDILEGNPIKLFGIKYALLGRNFNEERKTKNPSAELKNILVFFGGGDHMGMTGKILQALIENHINDNIKFNVVVGAANIEKDKIKALCESSTNFTFHCQVNNMAEIMRGSDLFIGAGGTTSWERMCIGLPGIIISIADNQVEGCLEMEEMGVIKYLGSAEEFDKTRFIKTLEDIKNDYQWRLDAFKRSQAEVDGTGAKRVASVIAIKLKEAVPDDCRNIFNWRNSEENRRYSLRTDKIIYEGHEKWFHNIINDKNHSLLIAYHKDTPVGVVRFDYSGSDAEISLYLTQGNHGKGLGLPLLYVAELYLKDTRKEINVINAKVIEENIASMKIFTAAMYQQTGKDGNIIRFSKNL